MHSHELHLEFIFGLISGWGVSRGIKLEPLENHLGIHSLFSTEVLYLLPQRVAFACNVLTLFVLELGAGKQTWIGSASSMSRSLSPD